MSWGRGCVRSERYKSRAARLPLTPIPTMPAPHLPQELIDHIISCIGGYIGGYHDPRLRAAALVCRAWVEPARRVMLRTVHLRSLRLSICAALLGLLDRTPAVAEYIKEIFWDLRDSYHTDDLVVHPLLDRISTITVKHGISQRVWIDLKWNGGGTFAAVLDRAPAIGPFVRDVQWFFDDGRQELWTDSEIVGLELARRLRRMRKLALTQTGYFPFEATAPFSRLPNAMASTSVTHLCLNCVVFSSTAEYASFISSFTRLKDLHIDHVEIKDQELADFSGSVSPPLRSVVLGPTESKLALFSYLINAPTSRPRVLTTLHAVIGLDVSGVVVNRLLQAYDATLRTLSLRGAYEIECHEDGTDALFRLDGRGHRPIILSCSDRS
jgi:hypothetical protein